MGSLFRCAMDGLYALSVFLAGFSMVVVAVVIPYGVFCRYVLNSAASWPEPMAILLSIVITLFGAAACYRMRIHMRVGLFVELLPRLGQRAINALAELLVGALGLFMAIYGLGLVQTTWNQTIAEFPVLSVGVTYMPIPLGGVIIVLFAIERLLLGPPLDGLAASTNAGH
jgi:TRAP-type C4-dicarboxylate transport system permease small subunit